MNAYMRTRAALTVLAASAALAACSAEPVHPEAVYVAPKTITAEWRIAPIPVAFPLGSAAPAAGELVRLDHALYPYADNASARFFVETDPASSGREVAARRFAMLKNHMASLGFTVEPVAPDGTHPPAGPTSAVVYVAHYAAVTPSCPDWRKPTSSDYTNTQSSNFGCATMMNFAQMLADPGDLLRGQQMGPADGARAAIAIDNYRQGKKPGDQQSSSSGGTGSAAASTTSGGTQQ